MEKEEPPEETDLILHDDDDDAAEDSESTGTVVAEAVVTIVFHADGGPKVCSHRAVVAHVSGLSPTATILVAAAKFQMP